MKIKNLINTSWGREVSKSLSFKQVRIAVITGFILGFGFSAIQIITDLQSEKKNVDHTFNRSLIAVEKSAFQAAYGLDNVLAQTVVHGLFQQSAVIEAKMIDSYGDTMAIETRSPLQNSFSWVAKELFGETKTYLTVLKEKGTDLHAGDLSIRVDTNVIAQAFFQRSGLILIFGILRNLIMAIILALFFHTMLTKPLRNVALLIREGAEYLDTPHNHKNDELGEIIRAHNKLSIDRDVSSVHLRRSEEHFRRVFEDSGIGMTIAAFDGKFLRTNDAFCAMVGYQIDELEGKTISDITHPDDLALSLKDRNRNRSDRVNRDTLEKRYIHKDGNIIWGRLNRSAIIAEDGSPLYFVSQIQDITIEKRHKDQLRQSQRLEAVGQLTGGVAHDFNNLMAIMMGNLERALDDPLLSPSSSKKIEEALSAVDKGAVLTQQLLSFSRQQILAPRVVDANELVEEMVVFLERTLGENIKIVTEYCSEKLPINIDPAIFGNALINLALNARDAMPQGGELKIKTALTELDYEILDASQEHINELHVVIKFSDTGVGIDNKDLNNVFEPFFTTKEVGEGSGMGLSMVYGFIRQSNGYVDIQSEKGKGTVVSFLIPVTEEIAEIENELQRSSPVESIDKTILLVEDDLKVSAIISTTLSDLGYKVIEAEDGPSALKILDRNHKEIDVIFSDVVMPNGMSGIELAKIISKKYTDKKIVLASGYPDKIADEDDIKALDIQLIAKPFRRSQLIAAVENAISHRTEHRDKERSSSRLKA